MKKLFLLSLFAALALVTQNTQADFGSSFGGSLTGSLVGSAIGNATTRPQTVYVRESNVVRDSDDVESSRSSRGRKRKMRDLLEEENDELRSAISDFNKRLTQIEDSMKKSSKGAAAQ